MAEKKSKEVKDAAIQRSAGIECGICLDVVLEKSNINDRRFGILGVNLVDCAMLLTETFCAV